MYIGKLIHVKKYLPQLWEIHKSKSYPYSNKYEHYVRFMELWGLDIEEFDNLEDFFSSLNSNKSFENWSELWYTYLNESGFTAI